MAVKIQSLEPNTRFGNFMIVNLSHVDSGGNRVYNCKCDCGITFRRRLYEIHKFEQCCKKCADLNRRLNVTIGDTYRNWTVLELDTQIVKKKYNNNIYYICQCKCGNVRSLTANFIINSKFNNCIKCNYDDLIGSNNPKWLGGQFVNGAYWNRMRHGAKKRNLEFSISIKYIENLLIEQNHRCALTGTELFFKSNSKVRKNASLDRIDSSKGYIEGNVQWVHQDINRMKWNFDQDYFIKLCQTVVEHNGQTKN